MSPKRIQRQRSAGWRIPEGAVYVGRPSRYGNPYVVGEALARVPALDGSEWEPEDRISAPGYHHPYMHADGHYTRHVSRLQTRAECVESFRLHLAKWGKIMTGHGATIAQIRDELAGKDLICWCPLDQPCHADVLLEIAATVPA